MYGKIFRQMYKGTLAMVGPWEALVTFQQMIVLADRDGVVDMTADAISRETTIPLQIIAKGIAVLELPDSESRSPDEEGRRIVRLSDTRTWGWRITNYAYYRQLRTEEERREYHRKYWREKRSKTAVTQPDSTGAQHNSTDSTNSSMQYAEGDGIKKTSSLRSESKESPDGSPAAHPTQRVNASRIPEDFTLTPEMRAYAEAEKLDAARTFDQFRDYWIAASGAKARKHDWVATWRTWCRTTADRNHANGSGAQPTERKPRKTRYEELYGHLPSD